MDLVSFVPGIGPTAAFTPGVNTPAPFNVSHTGFTNGTSPSTATVNQAEVYNRLLLQVAAVISAAGITIDNTNWTQLATAVKTLGNSGTVAITTYNANFANLLAQNGYQDIKGGLIFQWGVHTNTSDLETVSFPIAFPVACRNVQLTGNEANNNSSNNTGATVLTTTGFSLWGQLQERQNFWMAIGY